MVNKILITGSSGQIGSYLVEQLSKTYDVIGLDRQKSGIPTIDKLTRMGDIRDKLTVRHVVKKVDTIIHTAAQLSITQSVTNPVLDAEINIIGTLTLLDASRNNKNMSKFVYFSSAAVYGEPEYLPVNEDHPLNPISPYGISKLTGEKYCYVFNKIFGVPSICLRPFNVYSKRENPNKPYASMISHFINRVKNGEPIKIRGDGKQLRDFVHIKDLISFVEIILERENSIGETYNVGSGKPMSVLDIAKIVLSLSGKNEEGNIFYKEEEKEKINHSYADIKKSQAIGFNPKITIKEGIEEIIKS